MVFDRKSVARIPISAGRSHVLTGAIFLAPWLCKVKKVARSRPAAAANPQPEARPLSQPVKPAHSHLDALWRPVRLMRTRIHRGAQLGVCEAVGAVAQRREYLFDHRGPGAAKQDRAQISFR